jgi:hypothetical protein
VYTLEAVVAEAALLRARAAGLDGAVVAPLRQGLALLPVSEALVTTLTGSRPPRRETPSGDHPFALMSPPFEERLADWSRGGPVAYLEADLWAGDGHQAAAAWRGESRRLLDPSFESRFDGARDTWPSNAALALLGAQPIASIRFRCGHDPAPPVKIQAGLQVGEPATNCSIRVSVSPVSVCRWLLMPSELAALTCSGVSSMNSASAGSVRTLCSAIA